MIAKSRAAAPTYNNYCNLKMSKDRNTKDILTNKTIAQMQI